MSPKGISLSALLPIGGQNCLKSLCKDTISFIFSVTYIFALSFCLSLPFKKVLMSFLLLLVIHPEKM